MGNLADELDQLDSDYDESEELDGSAAEINHADAGTEGEDIDGASPTDGARDSGVDVSYASKRTSMVTSPTVRNFSKPFGSSPRPPDAEADVEEKLSPELEDAMNSIARMMSYSSTTEDPLIPRTIAMLQDLGNQANLETGTQRLVTSTNSLAAHLSSQSRSLTSLSASLYSPFTFMTPLDPDDIDQIVPLVAALLEELPSPDAVPLSGLQKLDRETSGVLQALSQLVDSLQMGRQSTTAASRHLRTTQNIVAELRRERERAETARIELESSGWDKRVRDRWCASECRDIVSGFEDVCNELRESLSQSLAVA